MGRGGPDTRLPRGFAIGSLYPALQRMKRKGWVRSEWHTSEHNRRARYYLLTAAGARRLEEERAAWGRAREAVEQILAFEAGPACASSPI